MQSLMGETPKTALHRCSLFPTSARSLIKPGLMAATIVGVIGITAAVPLPPWEQTGIAQAQESSPSTEPRESVIARKLAEASRLNQQVLELYQQRKYSEAIPLWERELEIRQQVLGPDHPDVAANLNYLGVLYSSQGRYQEAESLFQQALQLRKRWLGEEHPDVAESLNYLGVLYSSQGRYQEAEPLYQQALDLDKRLLGEQHPSVATSLNNLAGLYYSQGRYQEAEPLYQQALDLDKRFLGPDHPDVVTTLNNLAGLYYSQGRYQEAEPLYQQALDLDKRLLGEKHPSVATSLNNLAGLYSSQGRYHKAEPLYQQALQLRKRLLGEQHPFVATSLNNLAVLYSSQGRYQEAEPLFQQALQLRKRLLGEEHPDVATSLNNLAGLYYSQGRYQKAEPVFQQALQLRKRWLGDQHPFVATSLNNLAILYSRQGRYQEAEPLYKQALQLRKRLLGEQHLDVATNLNNLAELYSSQGRYQEAEPLFQQALQLMKRWLGEEHPSVATSLNNLAGLYSSQGRYQEAEPLYQQALQLRKRVLGEEHPSVATTLNNLAGLYSSQGRYQKAEPLYQQALQLRKQLLGPDHPFVAITLNNLALLYHAQSKITSALELFEQGLEVEERNLHSNLVAGSEPQKQKYLYTISDTTDQVISLHLNAAANNARAARLALTTVLRRKGRVLDFITNSQQILRQSLDPESQRLLDDLNATRTQLANLTYNRPPNLPLEDYQERFKSLSEQANQLEDQISRRSPDFRTANHSVTIEAIQKLIPANTALVELVKYRPFNPKAKEGKPWGPPRYAAYVLHSQGDPQGIDLGEVELIEPDLELFRLSLQDKKTPTADLKQAARQVDQRLMEPVRKLLGSTRYILLSPEGELNLIPFEALVDQQQQYLVENYRFSYLTSGRDLLRLSQESASQTPPVVLGNPDFDRSAGELIANQNHSNLPSAHLTRSIDLSKLDFSPLPGTAEEVQEIAKKLGVDPLLGAKATESAVKQVNSPRILHIATHGFFENSPNPELPTLYDNPMLLSGLVLAGVKQKPTAPENGVLTALEAVGLNLSGTELVVLSACDTGSGRISSGEGIYGLRRAFVIAGSQTQLISLRKVEDKATKELMLAYYQRLLDQNMGRTEALRQTQLQLLKDKEYQHPYYWASFIVSGNWRPMKSVATLRGWVLLVVCILSVLCVVWVVVCRMGKNPLVKMSIHD
ncbi:CHAT domain-containing tetratricopeptide repeat protein [Moorena bouillonii]|uniref:CHAT domain-containing tetratricopeptide repeat protein n=1 Tax=Moorena bouillonii TaxID=207920 RepID=UPI000AACEA4F|nr:CHAT domain-containing protein [Moorena bouillonii]